MDGAGTAARVPELAGELTSKLGDGNFNGVEAPILPRLGRVDTTVSVV